MAARPSTAPAYPFAMSGLPAYPDEAGEASGDEYFAELYREYFPRIVAWVVMRTGDRALGEDVAQETLLAARRYMDTYDANRPFWPWVRRIAGHVLGRRIATTVRERPLDEAQDSYTASLDDAFDRLCSRQEVLTAMSALPSRQREALWLRYGEDCSSHQAASAFGISPNAFNQLLWRARRTLREEFERLRTAPAAIALAPFGWFRWLRGSHRTTAGWQAAPLIGLPAMGMLVIGAMTVPMPFDLGGDGARSAERVQTAVPMVPKAHVATASLRTRPAAPPSQPRAVAVAERPAMKPADTSLLRAAQGPAASDVGVADNPARTGQVARITVEVVTPVGTAYADAEIDNMNSSRTVCRVFTCK